MLFRSANETDVLRVMYGSEPPPGKKVDRRWKWVLALLGVPVRQQHQQGLTRPWLTWGIALAVGAIFFTTSWLPALGSLLSLVPASVGRMAGLTVLTTFVLHGGWLHLFGNLCFLIIFGGPVEDYLGRARYLLLLVLATACALSACSLGRTPLPDNAYLESLGIRARQASDLAAISELQRWSQQHLVTAQRELEAHLIGNDVTLRAAVDAADRHQIGRAHV